MALICSFSSCAGLHAALTLPEVHPRHPSHAVSERSTPRIAARGVDSALQPPAEPSRSPLWLLPKWV